MATIDCSWAAGRLEGKVGPWYAEGVTVVYGLGIGADESDRDEVAVYIVHDNSPILYQSSTDVEISRNGAYAIFLQSKFMRYTGVIALHEVLYRGSWMVGTSIVFFKRAKAVEHGYTQANACVALVFAYPRYMQPEGLWHRLAAALADSSPFSRL